MSHPIIRNLKAASFALSFQQHTLIDDIKTYRGVAKEDSQRYQLVINAFSVHLTRVTDHCQTWLRSIREATQIGSDIDWSECNLAHYELLTILRLLREVICLITMRFYSLEAQTDDPELLAYMIENRLPDASRVVYLFQQEVGQLIDHLQSVVQISEITQTSTTVQTETVQMTEMVEDNEMCIMFEE